MPTSNPMRTWVEIDPTALLHNAKIARSAAGDAAVMAVVKADGYGHGLAEVTRALAPEVEAFGVATLNEALAVREVAGTGQMVDVLGALLPDEREPAVRARISVTVSSVAEAEAYSEIAGRCQRSALLHLALDTGMGRGGFAEQGFAEAAESIGALPGIEIEGLGTHFPSADEDPDFTSHQIERFGATAETSGLTPRWIHLSNSAGVLAFGAAGGNLVRPGLMLYGVSPIPENGEDLLPALLWKTRITLVRDLPPGAGVSYGRTFVTEAETRVATLAVGYGDGYPRHLSGVGASVLIGGQRCPLLGRVTMDQIMVDVSALAAPPQPGDVALLLGRDGDEEISAAELAERADTIPWEIFTGITPRVARVVKPGDSGAATKQ